jgi:hypothetical protein
MSHFLDRRNYFSNPRESFSDGFGVTNGEDRTCDDYARRCTDLPMLVMLREHTTPIGETIMVPDRYVRASLCGLVWPRAISGKAGSGRSAPARRTKPRTVQKGERASPTCPSADYRAFVPCVGGFPVGRKGSAKISELAAPARKLSMRAALTICGLPQR